MKLSSITPTSDSFVFATDGGCWSSETCIANLKLCVSSSKPSLFPLKWKISLSDGDHSNSQECEEIENESETKTL